MTIIATLLDAQKRGLGWKVKIEYSDGVDSHIIEERFQGSTVEDLKNFARSNSVKVETSNASIDYIPLIGQSIDVTPVVITPTPPTQAEIDKAAWFADWQQLKQIQAVFAANPSMATAPRLTLEANLQTSLDANWLDSYLGDI